MINLVKDEQKQLLDKIIGDDIYQNIYIYIDTITYGYNNEFIKTFILSDDENIKVILFHYYNSLQIFVCDEINDDDLNDIVVHIKKYNFEMITGHNSIMEKLYNKLGNIYNITNGVIMKCENNLIENSGKSLLAKVEEYKEIATLICSDENIGSHYSVDLLCEQLKERSENQNCKSLIIKENGKIVCHMATYADSPRVSVLGGLITDNNYRGLGYGKAVLNDITKMVQSENKVPVLYCYDKNVIDWYTRLGWVVVSTSSKLVKK